MIVIPSAAARKWLRVLLPFGVIPALVLLGAALARREQYALVILLVTAAAFVLFAAGFEQKKTGSRRMVVVAVMAALAVTGRFIPFFKPVAALTILTGLYLGGEAGFLTGALAAVISNFYFGQGPWTPFQMFAWGLIGLIAGALQRPLKKSRALLIGYGLLSGAAFSFLMDVWTVLWAGNGFQPAAYAAALATALPHTVLYALSNGFFLLIFARPIGEKLDRITTKYEI